MALVDIDGVSKKYRLGGEEIWALRGVTLAIDAGVFLAIAGPSGSGKSTLLNLIGCIDTPTVGAISIEGIATSSMTSNELSDLRLKTIGFIFQTFNLFPVLSAAENVEYPLLQRTDISREERAQRVATMLEIVGLSRYSRHRPNQLSGGQRQRVAIARALAMRPKIILADEPTANLDHRTGEGILQLMKEINRAFKTTFVFSTHDKKVIAKADRLVRIEDGRIFLLAVKSQSTWIAVKERGRAARQRSRSPDELGPPRSGIRRA